MVGPSTVPLLSDVSDSHESLGGGLKYFLSFWKTVPNDIVLTRIKGAQTLFDTIVVHKILQKVKYVLIKS